MFSSIAIKYLIIQLYKFLNVYTIKKEKRKPGTSHTCIHTTYCVLGTILKCTTNTYQSMVVWSVDSHTTQNFKEIFN